MRALVISGGGSKGAFAGGIAQYLVESGIEYDLLLGSSTGSILIPLIGIKNIEVLKEAMLTVTQDDIFDVSPFDVEIKSPINKISIHFTNIFKQLISGKKTFGESNNLRKRIAHYFTQTDFEVLKSTQKNIVVTVSNLTTNDVEYKSIHDCSYEDFIDWIWISGNYIPFMSLVTKNNNQYADGGFGSFVPVKKAIELGATEVDVILLDVPDAKINFMPSKNVFSLVIRLLDYMLHRIQQNDIDLAILEAQRRNIKMNFYIVPKFLTENPLVFDPSKMKKWWNEGYQYAKKQNE